MQFERGRELLEEFHEQQ